MQRQITQRLAELNQEFEQGNARFQRLERERAELRETLFRIQGAILALRELSAGAERQELTDDPGQETAETRIPVLEETQAVEEEYTPQSIEE